VGSVRTPARFSVRRAACVSTTGARTRPCAAPGDVRGRSRRQAERAHDNVSSRRRSRSRADDPGIDDERPLAQTYLLADGSSRRQGNPPTSARPCDGADRHLGHPSFQASHLWRRLGHPSESLLSPDRRQAEHLLVSRRSGLSSPSECDTPPRIPGRFRFSMRNSWPRPAVAPVRRFPS